MRTVFFLQRMMVFGREVEASREHLLARAGWPRTVLGGYLPGH
jgi:hypothetical protein